MKRLIPIFIIIINACPLFANDFLPQNYTPNNINPYKSKLFEFVRFTNPDKLVFNNEKYNEMLTRLELEWFKKDFSYLSTPDRLNKLEEYIFGTSFEENIENRCNRLKQAFNAQKQIKKRGEHFSSGFPTGIPDNIESLSKN